MSGATSPVPTGGGPQEDAAGEAQRINGGPALGVMEVGGSTPPIPLGVAQGPNAPRVIVPPRASGPQELPANAQGNGHV